MNKPFWTATQLCAATVAGSLFTSGANAQTTNSSSSGMSEVVVTARKTSENLQTTPVAVTALNTEALAAAQVTNVSDLQRAAPSLTVSTGGPGGPGMATLSMRGQVGIGGNSTTDPSVQTYIDGVDRARTTSGNIGLMDIAQVEVLRGPQGTLFGRNTTGGALNITTVQPNGQFGGYLQGTIGNYKTREVEGAVTVPLKGEELSARLAIHYQRRGDGYFTNGLTGDDVADMPFAGAGRLTLKWAPADSVFSATVTADRAYWYDNGQQTAVAAINTGWAPLADFGVPITLGDVFAANGLDPNDYIVGHGGRGKYNKTYGLPSTGIPEIDTPRDDGVDHGVAVTLNFDFSSWSLKSISAVRSADADNSLDLDGTPLRLISSGSEYRQDQYSEELQASTKVGALDLIGGLFAFREQGREQSIAETYPFINDIFGIPPVFFKDDSDFKSTSLAAYAQGNYHFTDRLRGTIGYRYTWDNRKLTRHAQSDIFTPTCENPAATLPGCDEKYNVDFGYPAWTIGLDYQVTSDWFVYIKSSRASLAGGFNTRAAPEGQQAFDPQRVTDVEVGTKIDLLDGRLRADIAAYHVEGKNWQNEINGVVAGRVSTFTSNAGDTEINGVELEVTARPWEGMTFELGANYVDAGYKNGTFLDPDPSDPTAFIDRSGEPLSQAPQWTYTVGATQDFHLPHVVTSIHLDYSWIDTQSFGSATPSASATPEERDQVAIFNAYGQAPSYGVANGRVSISPENTGLEFALWGRNLGNKKYYGNVVDFYDIGFVTRTQGDPRTYGLDIKYTF